MPFLALVVALLVSACDPAPPTAGDPDDARTVASMLPKLTRSLTPASAEAAFGKPDEITGSGLIIYRYRVEGGRTLSLGFPGHAPITYAKVLDASGVAEELPLLDR
jgi:hypothetical protein